MGRRTISIREEAYERLEAHRREGESLSDVVIRRTNERTVEDIEAMAGWLDDAHLEGTREAEAALNEALERRTGE